MPTSKLTIAIDGPAGSGKSTIAHLAAERFGLEVLDTGAMYRAVALIALKQGVQEDLLMATEIAQSLEIEFDHGRTLANSEDVSDAIRTLEVGQWASKLSTAKEIRVALVRKQREMVARGGYVLEGRDVTTVVAPGADLKIFLTASIEERARRRWLEMKAKGGTERLQEVVVDVVERDHRDYSRTESPLTLAEDAIVVETFGKTPGEVVAVIEGLLPESFRL